VWGDHGCGVIMVVGWMLCSVDTAKMKVKKKTHQKKFHFFFCFAPHSPPPIVNKFQGFVYGMCSVEVSNKKLKLISSKSGSILLIH
jgi:hypothetical protein